MTGIAAKLWLVVLQSNLDPWLNGNWMDAIFDPVTSVTGVGLFAVIVGAGAVVMPLYLAGDGDLATPTVVLLLLSGILLPLLPGRYHQMAVTLAIIGVISALLSISRRYVLS